jgi:hypothetical protein
VIEEPDLDGAIIEPFGWRLPGWTWMNALLLLHGVDLVYRSMNVASCAELRRRQRFSNPHGAAALVAPEDRCVTRVRAQKRDISRCDRSFRHDSI